jgi:hypothetical protein
MPRNARTSHSGRFYELGRGGAVERYWSVTTILSALPKDALKFWAAKQVAAFAVDRAATWYTMERDEAVDWLSREPLRYTGKRADYGTAVHAAAEAWAVKKPMRGNFSDEERAAAGQFLRFAELLQPRFVATEATVYSRAQKYAGTLDAIVEIEIDRLLAVWAPNVIPWQPKDGASFVRLIIDLKTGGDVEEGRGVYPEAALQLAAYARAEFLALPNGGEAPIPELDGAAVLHLNAGGWRLVPADALNPAVFKAFLFTREVFRWIEETSKTVLGIALDPPADTGQATPAEAAVSAP